MTPIASVASHAAARAKCASKGAWDLVRRTNRNPTETIPTKKLSGRNQIATPATSVRNEHASCSAHRSRSAGSHLSLPHLQGDGP